MSTLSAGNVLGQGCVSIGSSSLNFKQRLQPKAFLCGHVSAYMVFTLNSCNSNSCSVHSL